MASKVYEVTCRFCGTKFESHSHRAYICDKCRPKANTEKAQRYNNGVYDGITFHMPKGSREILKRTAAAHHMSLAALLQNAVYDYLGKLYQEDLSKEPEADLDSLDDLPEDQLPF